MKTRVKITRCDVSGADFMRASTAAEKILASEIHKLTRPFVPFLTGTFDRNSRVIDNVIEYRGDQVNYLWNGVKMVNAKTGKGPMVIPGVGPRWPKGAMLVPTSTPLNYTTEHHAKAGPAWMERSERDNAKKFREIAEEAVCRGLDKY